MVISCNLYRLKILGGFSPKALWVPPPMIRYSLDINDIGLTQVGNKEGMVDVIFLRENRAYGIFHENRV